MIDRSGKAPSDPIPWLLEGGAAERHAALTRLLGAAPDAPEVQEARRAIMTEGPVPRILAAQLPDGHWVERDRFYRPSTSGTVWTLIILAELGADGADARVRAGCEAVLRDAQDPDSGGFSYDRSKKAGGGLPSGVIPCLTGNMVFSLIRLGMLDDPRVQRASTGSPPTSASTTPRATRPPAGPTTSSRCAGAATPATWARSRR